MLSNRIVGPWNRTLSNEFGRGLVLLLSALGPTLGWSQDQPELLPAQPESVKSPVFLSESEYQQLVGGQARLPRVKSMPIEFCRSQKVELAIERDDPTVRAYEMVSLAECNGVNYLPPVRDQTGGTCATTSALDFTAIVAARRLNHLRPTSHDPLNFHSMRFGEFFNERRLTVHPMQTGEAWPHKLPVLNETWGAVLDTDFPDSYLVTRDQDENWKTQTLPAVTRQFRSLDIDSCFHMYESEPGRFEKVSECLVRVAAQKRTPMVFLDGYAKVDTDHCISTISGARKKCSNVTGTFGKKGLSPSEYQIDYEKIEDQIMAELRGGYPVRASIGWTIGDNWKVDYASSPYYAFRRMLPGSTASHPRVPEGEVFSLDAQDSRGNRYRFPNRAHAVIIVGYMIEESQNGDPPRRFFIIKNSHGDAEVRSELVRSKELFALIEMPSSSTPRGARNAIGLFDDQSTQRIFFVSSFSGSEQRDQPSAPFVVARDVSFGRMHWDWKSNPSLATSRSSYARLDRDGDGVVDWFDNCPLRSNASQEDRDGDLLGDACDPCPFNFDRYQRNSNLWNTANDLNLNLKPDLCESSDTRFGGFGFFQFDPDSRTLDVSSAPTFARSGKDDFEFRTTSGRDVTCSGCNINRMSVTVQGSEHPWLGYFRAPSLALASVNRLGEFDAINVGDQRTHGVVDFGMYELTGSTRGECVRQLCTRVRSLTGVLKQQVSGEGVFFAMSPNGAIGAPIVIPSLSAQLSPGDILYPLGFDVDGNGVKENLRVTRKGVTLFEVTQGGPRNPLLTPQVRAVFGEFDWKDIPAVGGVIGDESPRARATLRVIGSTRTPGSPTLLFQLENHRTYILDLGPLSRGSVPRRAEEITLWADLCESSVVGHPGLLSTVGSATCSNPGVFRADREGEELLTADLDAQSGLRFYRGGRFGAPLKKVAVEFDEVTAREVPYEAAVPVRGSWTQAYRFHQGDRVHSILDYDGDGISDLLIEGESGLSIATLTPWRQVRFLGHWDRGQTLGGASNSVPYTSGSKVIGVSGVGSRAGFWLDAKRP